MKKLYCWICEVKVTPMYRLGGGKPTCHLCGNEFSEPYINPNKVGVRSKKADVKN